MSDEVEKTLDKKSELDSQVEDEQTLTNENVEENENSQKTDQDNEQDKVESSSDDNVGTEAKTAEPATKENENVEENEQKAEKVEDEENLILYNDSFSNFSGYLKEIFQGTSIQLIKLDSIENIYDYAAKLPRIFITDVPLELGFEEDYVHLNDYITCPKIYIFENNNELNQCFDELSKFNIFGLAKDDNLKERIFDHLGRLELVEVGEGYFEMDGLEIESFATVSCNMKCLDDGSITIARPGINEVTNFDYSKIFLPNFQARFEFTPSDTQIVDEELVIKTDTKELIEQLRIFEFENSVKINLAYIADNPPRYQVFNKLDVKANYYKSYDDYEGKEDIIIVEDKKLGTKRSSGTEIAKLQDKSILIFSRVFPEERYVNGNSHRVNATTNIFDLNAIKDIIQNYLDHRPGDNKYNFDIKNDLARAEIRVACKISSINETFINLEFPFRLEKASKIKIDFFSESYMTVLSSEGSNNGFTVQCQLDSLSEIEINRIRQLLNKMNYIASKEIDLNKFKSADEVLLFNILEHQEKEAEEGGGESSGESGGEPNKAAVGS